MLNLLYDFLPILVFFVGFKIAGIYIATFACMVCVILQTYIHFLKYKTVPKQQLFTGIIIVLMGTATIIFKNEMFIKWKPTVIYWIFSLAFFVTPLFADRTLAEKLLAENINLPNPVWKTLNLMCTVFFAFMGVLNLWVIYHFSTQTWVNFKLFGTLILTVFFATLVAIFISKHALNNSSELS